MVPDLTIRGRPSESVGGCTEQADNNMFVIMLNKVSYKSSSFLN